MHGEQETSRAPRTVCTLAHLGFLAIASWIYFGGGGGLVLGWFGAESPSSGDLARRVVLLSFGVILFVRMIFTLFLLLKRRFGWEELGGVLFALLLYQVGFALLAAGEESAFGALGAFGIALFLIGSYLNTGSELQRKRFKDNPENKGVLYTQGLWRYARHINYFGDTLWVTGWAIVTRNWWSAIIPAALAAAFVLAFIPSLTKHLRGHYGEQFEEWERSTRAFIPFIY